MPKMSQLDIGLQDATCVAFSGFFLREDCWSRVRRHFAHFICVDSCRDDARITLTEYVDVAVTALSAVPPPYIFLAHSFGGLLAWVTASRLNVPVEQIILLSAIGVHTNRSASEIYYQSGQSVMSLLCRLDLDTGTVRLTDEKKFKALMFGDECCAFAQVHDSEPLSMLIDSTDATRCPMPRRGYIYVVTGDDRISSVRDQMAFATTFNAKARLVPGGHFEPLIHPSLWLGLLHSDSTE
jgi:pimeloyl-ACP methyl ester carboxylesterase